MNAAARPTKKQKQLLEFVEQFITEHGYGPSYREIMAGCKYSSVATVSLHVNNLINKGHLRKKDNSARSLEVVEKSLPPDSENKLVSNVVKPAEEKWLVENINHRFKNAENSSSISQDQVDELYVLVGALKILGLEGASQSFVSRLKSLKDRAS